MRRCRVPTGRCPRKEATRAGGGPGASPSSLRTLLGQRLNTRRSNLYVIPTTDGLLCLDTTFDFYIYPRLGVFGNCAGVILVHLMLWDMGAVTAACNTGLPPRHARPASRFCVIPGLSAACARELSNPRHHLQAAMQPKTKWPLAVSALLIQVMKPVMGETARALAPETVQCGAAGCQQAGAPARRQHAQAAGQAPRPHPSAPCSVNASTPAGQTFTLYRPLTACCASTPRLTSTSTPGWACLAIVRG
jgi:hypothetical protein